MVLVHRLKGEPVFLNADLIESIESTPDTVVTLADGRRVMLSDTPEEVVDRIRTYRASVLAAADQLRSEASTNVLRLPQRED